MIRLDLMLSPRWVDLGGVRLLCRPLTTAVMFASRKAFSEDMKPEELNVAYAQKVAELVVDDWEGVGDENGDPLPLTRERLHALLTLAPAYRAFEERYLRPWTLLQDEKKD